jgi:hypothetical protein
MHPYEVLINRNEWNISTAMKLWTWIKTTGYYCLLIAKHKMRLEITGEIDHSSFYCPPYHVTNFGLSLGLLIERLLSTKALGISRTPQIIMKILRRPETASHT